MSPPLAIGRERGWLIGEGFKLTDLSDNPWLTIWTAPRATMRRILDTDPTRRVLLLAMLGGFAQGLGRFSMKDGGDALSLPVIFLVCAVMGPLFGLLSLYTGGALLFWSGRWIGGRAPAAHVRAALAWSNVPLIWALLLSIPGIILFGNTAVWGFALIEAVVGIWALVIFLICLSEAQQFSIWKTLGNTLLSFAVLLVAVGVPLILLAIAASFIS